MPGVSDSVWREQDTTPGAIEAALRQLLKERHAENASYVPARVLNLVCVVDREWSGEIANRLRGVGRFHASRTVVCAVDPKRTTIDATASIAADSEPSDDHLALTRETVIVDVGPQHLEHLDTIVDPLVVTDLATVVWSPHGHEQALEALLRLSQVVLLDSIDEPNPADAVRRARRLSDSVYVVDLAWLRSTPWRERIAATFDPAALRPDLRRISAITVRHHADSTVAAMLLIGWLASRLDWRCEPLIAEGNMRRGSAEARRHRVKICLEPEPDQQVRGLAGLTLETSSGRWLSLERGPGGLQARYRNKAKGAEREWTVLGASRGEPGILGEGIRQALLRDPTYAPALEACQTMLEHSGAPA
ncbi:MAG TPA: glucose-6-phosphate dehydrogenase assembly protein OpcA [Solirubrobacteraceae bacterium]|jgi:glucose-6-phosphate dehydrogenase assembly protein OpcA|nr:glucose-6-phosphate dehydrogenase assembly protein OpcA [Solirubrobacteraceae bacterium]